jgi:hypothetical protein
MSKLSFEYYEMPGADLGRENPLPDISHFNAEIHDIKFEVPEEDMLYIGYGNVSGILPYKLQDNYNRSKKMKKFNAAVLENDKLKAVFLLDFGGRLWSLIHKPTGRELLYKNPVFQPANLALRNAWFSGGVEWNIGMRGHTPFTCSPLHAEKLTDDDGTPVLRLYEWERIRQASYQMDFYLPDNSEFLFARIRIINHLDKTIPMYWWSNIAVPEKLDVRVIVPAEKSYNHNYKNCLNKIDIPYVNGTDISYSTNIKKAVDYFFCIPEHKRRWISALDKEGTGLVQASTKLLKGRKLFAWGMGTGGRHWQEYLSVPVFPYIELQAGLARTQMECLPMPERAEWEWLEAYGLMAAEPDVIHGGHWDDAVKCVEAHLENELPDSWLENELERTRKSIADKKGNLVSGGSGWAALENLRRKYSGQERLSFLSGFDDGGIGEEQKPWVELLTKGELPYISPLAYPGGWMIQKEWENLLEASVNEGRSNHWYSRLHIGVMRFAEGDIIGARAAWEESLAMEPSPWALRNLAMSLALEKEYGRAADLMFKAYNMMQGEISILKELFSILIKAGRFKDVIDLYAELPEELEGNGRLKLYYIAALFGAGRLDDCVMLFGKPFEVFDIRELEGSFTDLWFRLQEELLAQKENIEVNDSIKSYVAENCFPPAWMEFR